MSILFKLIRICLVVIAAGAVASCGSSGGGESDHSPSISNLRYSPSASVQTAGGTASVDVLLDFADAGGDVATARMSISSGADQSVALSTLGGVKKGTSAATFRVPLDTVGKYTFDVWLMDGQGAASPHLSGTFEVLARDTTIHPPSISNLRYSPASAIQAAGGATSVVASVDFADLGADIASLRLTTSAGADLTIPLSNLSGLQNGTATGTFVVSTTTVGRYTFEAWLVDSKSATSNHLSGAFEVLASTPARDPPTIAGLTYSPTRAVQSAGGTATINISVGFSDDGADVVSARFMSSAGPDLSVPVISGNGIRSGTATASFVVSTTSLGAFTFQVRLVDSKGDSSNNLSGSFEILPAGSVGAWTMLAVSPPDELLGVGWDGRRYVAVGYRGTVMTSPDLNTWSVQASGVGHTLRSIASSGSRFVAVGDDGAGEAIVIGSTDGATWSVALRAVASPAILSKVIWTGTQFVAVGQERAAGEAMVYALVLTSADGSTWTKRAAKALPITDDNPNPQGAWVTSVAWSGSVFVLAAVNAGWEPVVWVSSDAETWTRHDLPSDAVWIAPERDITFGNGRFVAVGDAGWTGGAPVFTSVDGIHWTLDSTAADLPAMNAVTTGANQYLAVGDRYSQTSTDGLVWVASAMPGCGNDVIWDGRQYVAVGAAICRSN